MKKYLTLLAGFLVALTMCVLSVHSAPPSKMLIKHEDVFKKLRKAPVPFNHEAHIKRVNNNCKECHHMYTGKGEPKPCSACHKAKKEGKKVTLKKAFHKKCKGCHKKYGKKKLARKCSSCHKKQ